MNLGKVLPGLRAHPLMLLQVREILKCFADTLAESDLQQICFLSSCYKGISPEIFCLVDLSTSKRWQKEAYVPLRPLSANCPSGKKCHWQIIACLYPPLHQFLKNCLSLKIQVLDWIHVVYTCKTPWFYLRFFTNKSTTSCFPEHRKAIKFVIWLISEA